MFDKLYKEVVFTDNIKKLKELFAIYPIDIHSNTPPCLTLAGYFAMRGRKDKVELLRKLGASKDEIACGYAYANNHKEVEYYRTHHNADVGDIACGYAMAGNIEKVNYYITKHKVSPDMVALGFATTNNTYIFEFLKQYQVDVDSVMQGWAVAEADVQMEQFRVQYQIAPNQIACMYAIFGKTKQVAEYKKRFTIDNNMLMQAYTLNCHDDEVETLRLTKAVDVDEIAMAYAERARPVQVEKYRQQFGANPDYIAKGYAIDGNEIQVNRYLTEHKASLNSILQGFVQGHYHELIDKFQHKFAIDVREIAHVYKDNKEIPVFYQAIIKLLSVNQGEGSKETEALINVLTRLKQGANSSNPYWMNSKLKLEKIVKAVLEPNDHDSLNKALLNKESALYKAVNFQRISPLTLFGHLGQTRSLAVVETAKMVIR